MVFLSAERVAALCAMTAPVGSLRVIVDCASFSCSLYVADRDEAFFTEEASAGSVAARANGVTVSLIVVAVGEVALGLPAGSVSTATALKVPSARPDAGT